MEDHHQPQTAGSTSFANRAASPYDRLATAVAARNAVLDRHARELAEAQRNVDDAMTAVTKATKAPARSAAGRRGSRGRSS